MTFWKRLLVPVCAGGAVGGGAVEVGVGVEVSATEGRTAGVFEADGSGDSVNRNCEKQKTWDEE